jgi:tetratricopeptide (TPR) repeat protein
MCILVIGAYNLRANSFRALGNKATAVTNLKLYEETLKIYNKALQIAPDSVAVLFNKACIYISQGNKEEFFTLVKRVVELDLAYKIIARNDDYD